MAREVLSNGVINPDKYQADWYADLSNNWNLLNNLIGSAISGSEVDSKIATAIQELMIRTFQIVTELPATGTEGVMYLVLIPDTSKYTAHVWENNAYRELGVIQMTITIDDELSTTSENPVQNKVITNALGGKASSSHTHSASDITSGLATVATSGSYNDLSNKPTIPTVNNATLTIQKNGTNVQTFTANQSTNATANITVPTKTSDLTNDSGFITSDDTKIPLAGSNAISGDLIPATNGTVNLGSPSYQWNNAYIKSLTINGTACGDILTHNVSEFVDVSSNQTIKGTKTFSAGLFASRGVQGDLAILEDSSINSTNEDANGMPLIGHTNSIKIKGSQTNVIPCMLTGTLQTSGTASAELRVYKYKDLTKRAGLSIFYEYVNDKAYAQFTNCDITTNAAEVYNIGSSIRRFNTAYIKSVNGIAPDELGLPTSTYTDVSSYITNFDYTANTFTAPVSGMLYVDGGDGDVIIENTTVGCLVNFNRNPQFNNCRAIMFIGKGEIINVYCNYSNFARARIYHLKGKV